MPSKDKTTKGSEVSTPASKKTKNKPGSLGHAKWITVVFAAFMMTDSRACHCESDFPRMSGSTATDWDKSKKELKTWA